MTASSLREDEVAEVTKRPNGRAPMRANPAGPHPYWRDAAAPGCLLGTEEAGEGHGVLHVDVSKRIVKTVSAAEGGTTRLRL